MNRTQRDGIFYSVIFALSTVISPILAYVMLTHIRIKTENGKAVYAIMPGNFFSENTFSYKFTEIFLPLAIAVVMAVMLATHLKDYRVKRRNFSSCLGLSFYMTAIFALCWGVCLVIGKSGVSRSRWFFVVTAVIDFFLNAVLAYVFTGYLVRHYHETKSATRVGIITVTSRADDFVAEVKKDWTVEPVIMKVDETWRTPFAGETERGGTAETGTGNLKRYVEGIERIHNVPVVADKDTFVDWIRKNSIDEVFINVDEDHMPIVRAAIKDFVTMGVKVNMNLPGVENFDKEVDEVTYGGYHPRTDKSLRFAYGVPMVTAGSPDHPLWQIVLKRIIDILGGIVGCIICFFLILYYGPKIKKDSPGPVIFKQTRITRNGRKFTCYKLRTMVEDAEEQKEEVMKLNEMEGLMNKREDDPRITKVGHRLRDHHIDEFPQFLNVLKGDMSIVGTRPPTEDEFQKYSSYSRRRLMMRTGITGNWQVHGGNNIKEDDKIMKLDLEYIDNWSIRWDIKIILQTLKVSKTGEGAE